MAPPTNRADAVRMLAIGLLALVALGCARRGNVTGHVRYEGKPLVFGTVQLEASDGTLHQSTIAENGTYEIRGVTAGEVRAAVSSRNPKSTDFIPIEKQGVPKMPRLPDIKGWFPIPNRYERFDSSGLVYSVQGGENSIDIDLKK